VSTVAAARLGLPRPTGLAVAAAVVLTAAVVGLGAVVSPFLGLAALVGLAFVLVTAKDLAGGIAAFTVLSFFERIPGTPETGVTVIKLAGGMLAVVWIVRILRRRSELPFLPALHPLIAYAVVAFAGWSLASILWAEDPGSTKGAAVRLVQGAILLFIVFSAVRVRRHLLWVLWAFVLGAVLSALIGLGGATAAEDIGPASKTIRLAGGIGDPNELAAIIVPAIVIAVGLVAVTRTLLPRFVLFASIGILALALFWTQSRGGLVAMGATAIIGPALAGSARPRMIAVVLSIGALAVTYFTLLAPPEQLTRVTSFDAGGGTGRPDLWAISIEMFRDHPYVGVGAGNFVDVEPRYATRDIDLRRVDLIVDTPKGAHNTYLHTITELGIVGMALLATVLVSCLLVCFRTARAVERTGDLELGLLGRAIGIGIIGMLAAFTFISAAHREQLWLLLGLAVAFANLVRAPSAQDEPATRRGD
jgi:putative inorganic carbon (HCO3(-)) transporter